MSILNVAPDRHSKEYNVLKTHIERLKVKVNGNHLLYALIAELDKLADEFETLYIQGMRNASTALNEQAKKYQERHTALMARLIQTETRLRAMELETQGTGTFLRSAGYHEVEDVMGNKQKIPLVHVRDQRGIEGRVSVANENIDVEKLRLGQRLLLLGAHGPGPVMQAPDEFDTAGREANVVALMDNDILGQRVMLSFGMEENRVCWVSDNIEKGKIQPDSRVLVDATNMLIIEILPEEESSRYVAAEIPATTFADIGGLDGIAAQLERDFIWPLLHRELYQKMGLPYSRGCLLSGPTGTGKTMIARALTNLIASQIEKTTGSPAIGYFFNIRGPELLDKYVGQSEHRIRDIFEQAKKMASDTTPVTIFFDEMDSLFLQRGMGISSDVNLTIVTQFCAMMDGLEDRSNIIVIGATNREELIDPAVLRPGRCNKKFRIPRPDAAGARQIFGKYLLPTWDQINPRYNVEVYHPLDKHGNPKQYQYDFKCDPRHVAEYLIERAVQRMYDTTIKKNEFIELMFRVGQRRKATVLRYGDLASGALIANIVERAKSKSVYDHLTQKKPLGVEMRHLYEAIEEEYAEQRAPKTLQEAYQWLLLQGYAEGDLIATPTFIDHSNDDKQKSNVLQNVSSPIQEEEDAEEF